MAMRPSAVSSNQATHHLPVIAITANAMTGLAISAEVGATGYVSKPIDIDLLTDVLFATCPVSIVGTKMNAPMFTEENNDTKPKVLIVDDNEGNVIAMQAVLGDLDIDVLTATLAEQAIYLAIVRDLALIIMDVHMPDMDGFETAERIRMSERSQHVPIMFVTGVKRSKDEVAGYNLGAVDYLLKPVDTEILRAKVGAFLDIYGHRLALEKDHELLRSRTRNSESLLTLRLTI